MKSFFLSFFLLAGLWSFGQPVNDDCINAIELSVGQLCMFEPFSSIGQTSEAGIAPGPACVGFSGGDVWFKFIMPQSGKVRVERENISGINAQFALYTGSCGAFQNLACAQLTNVLNVHNSSLSGQIIFIRVYNFGSQIGGDFNLCVWEPPIPDNDLCGNAIPLSVGQTCQMMFYSNEYCTSEPGIAPNPSCAGYAGGDVWFVFEVPESGHIRIEKLGISSLNNGQFSIYSGDCGNMTHIGCAQLTNSLNIHNSSLAGQNLYLRVYNYGTPQGGEFSICVWEPPIPDNDFCENAVTIEVGLYCQMAVHSNAYCTAETSIAPAPTCVGYQGGDVWFKFQAPSSGQFQILRNNLSDVNAQWTIYSGVCGNMVQIACAQLTSQLNINEQSLAGQWLFLRFYNYGSPQGGTFEFCIQDSGVPINDSCSEAFEIEVLQECLPVLFTNINCTAEQSIAPNPQCPGYQGGDVWFRFVVPPSGKVRIIRENIFSVNAQMSIYQGSCGGFEELLCGQLVNSVQIDNPSLSGAMLFLRVFNYGSSQGGVFSLCAFEFDCNGDPGNEAYLDNCGLCVGGNSGQLPCVADCFGDFGGNAYVDFCGNCVGGNSGLNSCPAPCLVDFDNSGVVAFSDLVVLLSEFGCTANCSYDLDFDGAVGYSDLVIFLGLFGGLCFY